MVLSIMCKYTATVQKPHYQGYPEDPETLAEHLKKRRMDMNMSQAAAARAIGVSEDCLCYWENGRNTPQVSKYPAIIAFLGYYPFDHETETFGGKIKRYKFEQGLSNEKLAKLLGADESTVANWERNKRVPTKKRLKYVLSIINKNTS